MKPTNYMQVSREYSDLLDRYARLEWETDEQRREWEAELDSMERLLDELETG